MYHLDNERFRNIIQHAYTDSGILNDMLLQVYLEQLQKGELRKIAPSQPTALMNSFSENYSKSTVTSSCEYADTTAKNRLNQNIEELTSTEAINHKNEADKKQFDKQAYQFLYILRHTLFEDDTENEITIFFSRMQKQNKYVAICWLQEFWSEHQTDAAVAEGVTRLIGRIEDKAYWKPLMSIVRAGLTDQNKAVQEAAIMVIESWRTLACYQALKQTQFAAGWIKDYASEVMLELEEELKDEIY